MKKVIYKNCIITATKDITGANYGKGYIITINGDILGFTDTIKEAKKRIDYYKKAGIV